MQDGVQLKYGHIRGGKIAVSVTDAGSQVITAASGKFVYMTAGAATLSADAIGSIFGHLEAEAQTTASGGESFNCIIDPTAVYRIPVNAGTYVVGMIGDTCDISISNDVQGAQLNASDENTLLVVGGDAVNNNWVDVMIVQSTVGSAEGGVDD